ncbi:pyrroloquinoline quinone biosynthesis peptide chaperone PqqD [Nitrosococcus watsonii]|uniref:PqqA binding protein n=1 Tax=Nitrosococcus watsoni (strain C-113) TaxID=105559 RepID=D8KAE5_NITWC|nr:pyrroloquinoline quinone biosynthesis peptide chaperone PqqD [Nitrosococcus watsonii]ADJ27460.1 coenzyme PQQ synthesis D [Nitrosococcus watsonii C-113]
MHDNDIPTIAPPYRFQWEEAQDCYVLLYPEGMIKLNLSAGEILKHCNGKLSINAIIALLQEQYPQANLANDVREFLETAYGNGWLSTEN